MRFERFMTNVIIISAVLGLIIGLGYAGWKIKRLFNYNFDYKDQVTETIKEVVKPECLR